MLAAVRADLHNTAGRTFEKPLSPSDFIAGAKQTSVEDRARELMEQGYAPAAAVAMASSSQSKDHKIHMVKGTLEAAHQRKQKQQGKPKRQRAR